jgi:ATP-dependent Lon protease
VILPETNRRDLEDLPKEVRDDLTFVFVDNVRQVFDEALLEPRPRAKTAKKGQ